MTNLLAQIAFVIATNWTGHQFNGQELGYVITNHIATVKYETNSYPFTLKSTASTIAVWRTPLHSVALTNLGNIIVFTNEYYFR